MTVGRFLMYALGNALCLCTGYFLGSRIWVSAVGTSVLAIMSFSQATKMKGRHAR